MVNLIKDNERGDLMAFDTIDVPFYVKRVFVVNNVPFGEIRGNHAHLENLQYFICTNGEILIAYNNGKKTDVVVLQKGESFLLKNMLYANQTYIEPNSELMVLCSHEYDKSDYITDFEEFKKLVNEN